MYFINQVTMAVNNPPTPPEKRMKVNEVMGSVLNVLKNQVTMSANSPPPNFKKFIN